MNNESFKTLKKASLASALGVFAFTYAGTSEANDEVVEKQLIESEIEAPEEVEVIENITEETPEEQMIDSEQPMQAEEPTENVIEETPSVEQGIAEDNQVANENYEIAEPAVEETIEIEYEEPISEETEVPETSKPQISTFAANDSSDMDIEAPELVSVTTDKTKYNAGEQIQMTVVAEDDTNVDYIYASFSNNSEDGPQNISGSSYSVAPLGNNRYQAVFNLDIPERTPSTSFRLTGLGLYDNEYENYLTDWYGEELLDLTIDVVNNSAVDIEPPKLISATTDKTAYNAGEQIEMTVVAEDDTNVDYIYASFSNNSEDGPINISGSSYTVTPLGNNRYQAVFNLDIPERTPSTSFRLTGLGLYDNEYENYLTDWYGEELLDLTIDVVNNSAVDIEPPELISVTTDKTAYNAGEQIEMTVVAEDDTNVDYIYASFSNNSEDGPQNISGSSYTVTPLGNNRYQAVFNLDIPERTPNTSFRLTGLGLYDDEYENYLTDWYGEELLSLSINIGDGATILPPTEEDYTDDEQVDSEIPEEETINDDLSQNYINHVSILDNETGQLISNVSFVGSSFDDRLNQVLTNINEGYGTEYNIVNQVLINSETSGVQINDYANYFTTDTYEVYVSNNSATDYPFENRPFLPDYNIYDDYYENPYGLMQVNIIDSYGNYLYSGETFGSYTVDGLIREVMTYIDTEEYYYESVYVSNGIMIRTDYYGEYQGIDVYVGNRVDESNEVPEEEITEQPDTEEPAEDPTVEQPGTDEPVVELTPEQPDTEESLEESAPVQTDTDNEEIVTETPGTENIGTDSVTPPLVNPVLPGADVISGVAVPESTGTITLSDGTEVTAESDSEGNWAAEIPADSEIEAGETITVAFYDEKTDTQTESAVTVASEEEVLLPDTGEAKANTGIIAALAAFLGGALLFLTGRRKVSKK